MNPYFLISIGGFVGIWLHVFVTMQTINKNTPQADFKMVWDQYWKTDYLSFIIASLAFVIYIFCLSEWININNLDSPDVKDSAAENILHGRVSAFIKTFSVVLGYFADYLVYKFIGKTKKIIDKKFEDDEKP